MKFLFATFLFLGFSLLVNANGFSVNDPSEIDTVKNAKSFFAEGKVNGHLRNYFMSTINHKELTDHYANAIGFELAYETAKVKGFSLGIAGLFTFNTFSSALDKLDTVTNKTARLETELFDIEDPGNKSDLDRLDELFLNYEHEKFDLLIGRFTFDSPLVNSQDGRMKPYSLQGLNANFNLSSSSKLKLGVFNNFSPRGTVKWYNITEVLGIYSTGNNPDGIVSGYKEEVHSKALFIAGIEKNISNHLKIEVWDYLLDHVVNTIYLKSELMISNSFDLGVEIQKQNQMNNGGNDELSKTYFAQNHSFLYGSKIGYHKDNLELSLNYLKITDEGRFLFPREFGREQFFVTVPRGRIEGLSNTSVLMFKSKFHFNEQWELDLDLGEGWLPSFNNFEQNKYSASSYHNAVVNLVYTPKTKLLDGFNFKLLYVTKQGSKENIPLANQYYNINYHNINFITQLNF